MNSIRIATSDDAPAFFDHLQRHFAESGKEGDPIFHPVENYLRNEREKFIADVRRGWGVGLEAPAWERAWVIFAGDQIHGHATLRGSHISSAGHRCLFGVGLERSLRGQGFGRKLSETCLDWAREQPGLEWMDLNVFSVNVKARKLYESLGFSIIGCTVDQFRVGGVSIDDIRMCKRLRE